MSNAASGTTAKANKAHRASGTGSIRKRGNTYTALWSYTDPATGKRRQGSKAGFKTKKAAQEHMTTVLSKVQQGSWRPDKPLTVRELLLDHWLPTQESRGLKPNTIARYRVAASSWIIPHIGGVPVPSLTPAVVTKLVKTLREEKTSTGRDGLRGRSCQLTVGVLKAACAWGAENNLLSRSPISSVRRPSPDTKKMKVWTAEDAESFLHASTDDRLIAAWALFLTRGFRRSELAGLRWSAVDLRGQSGTLQVVQTRVVVDGKAGDSDPKSASGHRSVPLDHFLVSHLEIHRTRQDEERQFGGDAYEDGGWVFTDELGRLYHPDVFSNRFERLSAAAKLPRIRLHDTRHTAASLMLADGVPVKVVQEMLGHSSPAITLAMYAHVLPGMAEEAGAALSARLLGKPSNPEPSTSPTTDDGAGQALDI
jgi:integrase